jgi:hypothetical protein
MEKIIFYDWHKGFNLIAFNKLLRKHLGYSLSQAKQAVDDLLGGQKVVIEVTTPTFNIDQFLSEAAKIGAEGRRDVSAIVNKAVLSPLSLSSHYEKLPYIGLMKEWTVPSYSVKSLTDSIQPKFNNLTNPIPKK